MLEGVWSVLVVWRESGRGVGRCVRGQGERERRALWVCVEGVREGGRKGGLRVCVEGMEGGRSSRQCLW